MRMRLYSVTYQLQQVATIACLSTPGTKYLHHLPPALDRGEGDESAAHEAVQE